jgi:curved DNA-binding protein CbpA
MGREGEPLEGPDWYQLLGVPPHASRAEIDQAYQDLASRLHPEAGGNAAFFSLLQQAHWTLSDPQRRAAYDLARWTLLTGGGAAYPPTNFHDPQLLAYLKQRARQRRIGGCVGCLIVVIPIILFLILAAVHPG